MQSARASHRATRHALGARFFNDWCERAPYAWFHAHFLAHVRALSAWPSPERYDELVSAVPSAASVALPRFVAQDRALVRRSGGYEQYVARERAVPTRASSWHDFFNMAVWAHFPRVRWALNAIHVDDRLGPVDPRNARAPAQNLAAQFDESGVIVASSCDALLADLKALRFKRVFWERRVELLATTRFWVVGHGMLESLLAPHLGLSAKALLLSLPRAPGTYCAEALRSELDARAADRVAAFRSRPLLLDPLPLLGIPDYTENARGSFYDDARYFRFERRSPRRSPAPSSLV